MRIVYGPIKSLGLGRAIAVDPISRHPKVCNFNCVYCHLGQRGITLLERTNFIDEDSILEQMGDCLYRDQCDAVIFKGTGEPLLASNVFDLARRIREVAPKKVALLTNCSLLREPQVLDELDAFDIIVAKLDAASEETFQEVNRPHHSIHHQEVVEGIKEACRRFRGSFRIQVTLLRENMGELESIAQICRDVGPEYVYLDHPEHCDPMHRVSKREMREAMDKFFGTHCRSSQERE
ncbi:MAG: radical SAM protein [Methanomassiliicoccales archaeon]|nr:radical SAM protein [Methanomassiliicoccales archaeon]